MQQELSKEGLNASNTTGHPATPANSTMNGSLLLRPSGNPGNTTAALEIWNSTGTVSAGNSSGRVGGNISVAGLFVDTGGPSCRPAELLDPRSGVVNYGC